MLLFGLFAIPAEAWLLSLTKRHPLSKVWRTAVYANITSFCLIVGLTILSYVYTRLFSS
ncbi:MAG: hypothetical protein R3C62_00500 [Chloroflexota bacterium]